MNLRKFLAALTAFAACALIAMDDYSFLFISDPHLGSAASYDMNPETNKMVTKKDITRADRAMPVLRALFQKMAQGNDAFLIEGGDLIEGSSFNAQTHAQQLQNSLDLLTEYFHTPIYAIRGNHDAYGNGGQEAYNKVLAPFMSRQCGHDVTDSNYSVWKGPDLFIFTDSYSTGVSQSTFIEGELARLTRRPRYLFVVSHTYPLPFPGSRPLLAKLLPYDAILLCGHSHQTLRLHYEKGQHKVTQFVIGTYLNPNAAKNAYRVLKTDFEKYTQWFIGHYAKDEATATAMKENFKDITGYWQGIGSGAARISVSDKGVTAEIQGADLELPTITLPLR